MVSAAKTGNVPSFLPSGESSMGKHYSILLTGAAGGIGSVIADYFAASGARLLLTDLNNAAVTGLAERLQGKHGVEVKAIAADLTSETGRRQITSAARNFQVNVLINSAGYNRFGLLADISDSDVERIFTINVLSPILLCKALLPWLTTLKSAHIVNIGSTFGSLGYAGFTGYSASKYALRGFSEALRRELADTPVKVHYLAPRAVRTAFNEDAVNNMNAALGVAMDEPDVIPGAIAKMLQRGQSEHYIGRPERFFVKLNALFSRLVDKGLSWQLATIQQHARSATGHAHTDAREPQTTKEMQS
jgi:short-subunit dehydrogenase